MLRWHGAAVGSTDRRAQGALLGHTGPVNRAVFSPRGDRVATASTDQTARVWAAYRDANLVAALKGHEAAVRDAAFCPDDASLVVTAGADNTARIWKVDLEGRTPEVNEAEKVLFGHTAPLTTAAFSPDGQSIVTAGHDGMAMVWTRGGEPRGSFEHRGARGESVGVLAAAFSPRGEYLLTSCSDGRMRVWDVAARKCLVPGGLPGSADRLTPVAYTKKNGEPPRAYSPSFNTRGDRVVTPSAGSLVFEDTAGAVAEIWDAGPGRGERPIRRLELDGVGPLADAAFSPDGTLVAAAGADGGVRLWDVKTGRLVTPCPEPRSVAWERVVFSPGGEFLAVEAADGLGRIWDVRGKKWLNRSLVGLTGPAPNLVFSPGSDRIATDGGSEGVLVWDLRGGGPVALDGRREALAAVAFDRGGKTVLGLNRENAVTLWNATTGETSIDSIRHGPSGYAATAAAFHVGQTVTRVVSAGTEGLAMVWDIGAPEKVMPLLVKGPVKRAAFSPDGNRIATVGYDGAASVWDATSAHPLGDPIRGPGLNAAAFSPDGGSLVVVGGEMSRSRASTRETTARVWTLPGIPGDHPEQILSGHKLLADNTVRKDTPAGVNSACFDGDGRSVVTAGGDGKALVWDFTTGGIRKSLGDRGHTEPVLDAQFCSGGDHVVTTSADNTARIWEAGTGNLISVLRGHSGDVDAAMFHPEGRFVVTSSRQDGTARVWEYATGNPLYVLRGAATGITSAALNLDTSLRPYSDDVNRAVFSRDGRFILTAHGDGKARVFACEACLSLDGLLELSQSRITRRLTSEEQAQYKISVPSRGRDAVGP